MNVSLHANRRQPPAPSTGKPAQRHTTWKRPQWTPLTSRRPFNAIAYGFLAVVVSLSSPRVLCAQSEPVPATVKSGFRPSYTVTPVVQKIKARRGETIPFKFEVESLVDHISATIRPVALRQDPNGAILADINAAPPANLRLTNDAAIEVVKGDIVTLEGEIRLPTNKSPFHTFGILIRDKPVTALGANSNRSNFGVKFVTQYILRCDIEVVNARHDAIRELKIDDASLLPWQGLPMAQVIVSNPNDTSVEFELDCRLSKVDGPPQRRYLDLVAPIRSSLTDDSRFRTLILPHSRLEMQAPLPRPAFAGRYELESRLKLGRRVYQKVTTSVVVDDDQFPAQQVYARELLPGIEVSPSQLALGTTKPLRRFAKITVENHRNEVVQLEATIVGRTGEPLDPDTVWVGVRPNQIEIRPSSRRTFVVSLGRDQRDQEHFGFLRLSPTFGDKKETPVQLPIAHFADTPSQLKLEVGDPEVVDREGSPALEVAVRNAAAMPVPLRMHLRFRDTANNPVDIVAGYGWWLAPEATREVRFPLTGVSLQAATPAVIEFLDAEGNVLFAKNVEL